MREPMAIPPVSPFWNAGDQQRRALAARVRTLRSWLIAGSLAGTVVFTIAAAHHTETNGPTTPASVVTTTENQTASPHFFAGQTTAPGVATKNSTESENEQESDDEHPRWSQNTTGNGAWFFSSSGSSGPSFFSNRSTSRSS